MTTTRTTTRTTTGSRRGALVTALAAVGALALAACGAPSIPADTPAFTASPAAAPTALAKPTCTDATTSYDPLPATSGTAAFPSGSLQAEIRNRKPQRLVVGVSGDSLLLGSRDPRKPTEFKGFDIDLARAVAVAIFGPGGDSKIQFRVITAAQRIPLVNAGVAGGGVDMVARNMTMNCDRWNQVAFSAVYFVADQRFLVRTDSAAKTLDDLVAERARVCAPAGSTSIQRMVDPEYAGIVPVQVDQHTTCLALLQQGRVDAITGDSTVLAGLKEQDKLYTRVLDDEPIGTEPYGLAVAKNHPEFARYLNAVLENYISTGQWKKSYDTYFSVLGTPTVPTPQYGRPLP